MKKRQREVSLANEVYCKLLMEALPSLYDGPKIYPRCSSTVLHDQEQIGYFLSSLSLIHVSYIFCRFIMLNDDFN